MKLTHETLVRGNPAQILLPRFTVSQIMRNDQQVSFRIFFTANYNTFSKDDYMVVKYAEPGADGMPKADKKGFVRYFQPPDGSKPNFGSGGDDSLVFGRLVYLDHQKVTYQRKKMTLDKRQAAQWLLLSCPFLKIFLNQAYPNAQQSPLPEQYSSLG